MTPFIPGKVYSVVATFSALVVSSWDDEEHDKVVTVDKDDLLTAVSRHHHDGINYIGVLVSDQLVWSDSFYMENYVEEVKI